MASSARHKNYHRALGETDPGLRDAYLASAEAARAEHLRDKYGDWTQDPREAHLATLALQPADDPSCPEYWQEGLQLTKQHPPTDHGWPIVVAEV